MLKIEFVHTIVTSILYSNTPSELANLEVISVLLSQEVNGPPSNVIEKLYNLFWLERRASMGNKFVACFREGISFGKHQTGRLVSFQFKAFFFRNYIAWNEKHALLQH